MKMCTKNPFLLRVLVAAIGSVLAGQLPSQTFTNLYDFSGGADGAGPRGALVRSGNTLCGTAEHGDSSGNGTMFAVNTDGTGFTNLY
jgi:hypothetical protein